MGFGAAVKTVAAMHVEKLPDYQWGPTVDQEAGNAVYVCVRMVYTVGRAQHHCVIYDRRWGCDAPFPLGRGAAALHSAVM